MSTHSRGDSIQTSITEFWNSVASSYEAHPGNTVPFGSAEHHRWVDLIGRLLPPPRRDVLDICTGTGFVALICAELGHRVTGMDLAPAMLGAARSIAGTRGFELQLVEGDAVTPPFEPDSFDVVICRHTLWTLRDADEALRNWRDLIRRGGRAVALEAFHNWDDPIPDPEADDFFSRHYTAVVQASLPFMRIQDETPLVEAFRRADFAEVQFEMLPADVGESADERPYALVAYR